MVLIKNDLTKGNNFFHLEEVFGSGALYKRYD